MAHHPKHRRPVRAIDRGARRGMWHRACNRARAATRRSDERGGAISLWVVLMVPVSAFAAVAAMAGPQRLAAESSMQDAADDLATFAVVWRDGHDTPTGELPAFPPECATRSQQQYADLASLDVGIEALDPGALDYATEALGLEIELDGLLEEFTSMAPARPAVILADPQLRLDALKLRFEALESRLDEWDGACDALFEALLRDLGYLGVDMISLRGFYSDSLAVPAPTWSCSNPTYTTQLECEAESEMWTPDPQLPVCRTSGQIVVRDAVHVAVAAHWQDAGWAAAQVWRDGLPMAAESIGRLSQHDTVSVGTDCTEKQLVLLDEQGRPLWAGPVPDPVSRKLVQSVGRTPLSR